MKKTDRMKAWIKSHGEEIAVAGISVGFIALYLAAIKKVNEQAMQNQRELEEAIARGDMVLPNPDGSFWIVSKNEE